MKISAEKIKKYLVLFLSLGMLVWSFALIPAVASALPQSLAYAMTEKSALTLPPTDESSGESPDEPSGTPEEVSQTEQAVPGPDFEDESPPPEVVDMTGAEYVKAINLCWYDEDDEPALYLMNRSGYKVSINNYADKALPFTVSDEAKPTVLIVHTHGTESYLRRNTDYYFSDEKWRSEDSSRGVVAAGKVLAETLESQGISVIHDKTMYDAESFNNAYTYSSKAVAEWLEKYPSIVCVIDIHRDSVFDSSDVCEKPVVTVDGKECAQLMLLVGTDEGGANHPFWQKNFTFAVRLQQQLNEDYPMLARPVCLRSASFNQQYRSGSLLIEIGSCGNSVDEAENTALYLGKSLAKLIKDAS